MPELAPGYRIKNCDCFEFMDSIPANSIDLVLTDPPYGTTQCRWDSVIPLERMWQSLARVTHKRSGILIFSSQPFTSALVSSNILRYKYEWVWEKSKVTGVLNAKRQPLRNHENIIVFGEKVPYYPLGLTPVPVPVPVKQGSSSKNYGERGKYGYTQLVTGYPRTVLKFQSQGKTVHPTQKPVALLEYFVATYSLPGMAVLDFCMGSGTTGVACGNLGRRFYGCDNDTSEGYYKIAEQRIKEAYANGIARKKTC